MKINKTIKRGLWTLAVFAVLFFGILIYHIVTAKPAAVESPHLQVSRIDFKENIDSAQAKKICADLRTIKGLTTDSIIVKRNVVVYFHNNSITNSKKVYDELMTKGHYDAQRYILPANMANKKVCPIDQNSFSYKMARSLNQIFN
jgi:thymidylate synthase ThyX